MNATRASGHEPRKQTMHRDFFFLVRGPSFVARGNGFTFAEMLIVLALMAFVFTVLVSMFAGGMRVWEKNRCGVRQEQEIDLAFDVLRRALHEMHPFAAFPFRGSHDKVEMPALIARPAQLELREPGKRKFYFDSRAKRICTTEAWYRGMRAYGSRDVCRELAANIDSIRFSYFSYNPESKSSSWTTHWSQKDFPVAVKMELEYHDLCSEEKSKKQFTISVPTGPVR